MSRILLVDDSPHAQRMGERILTEEGYEVVTVSNADSALIRLDDVDPDVVIADTVMPGRTGWELCQYVKMSPRHKHVRVIVTSGVLEPLEEEQVQRVEADGSLKKPFEASALVAAVKPLAEAAAKAREEAPGKGKKWHAPGPAVPAAPFVAVIDAEQVRAAVTVALDGAMEQIVDEIARRVLAALNPVKPAAGPVAASAAATPGSSEPAPPGVPVPVERNQLSRRENPLRTRSSSILGLELGPSEPDPPAIPGTGLPESGRP